MHPPGPVIKPVEEKNASSEVMQHDDQIPGPSNQVGPAREAPQSVKTFSQVCELIARAPKRKLLNEKKSNQADMGTMTPRSMALCTRCKTPYTFTVTKTTHVAKVVKVGVDNPVKKQKSVCTVCTFPTEAGETVHTHCVKHNSEINKLQKKHNTSR